MFVRESIQDARLDKPALCLAGIVDRSELEKYEHLIRIIRGTKDALCGRLLPRTRSVLLKHRPPSVVVANLNAGDDEGRHVTPFCSEGPIVTPRPVGRKEKSRTMAARFCVGARSRARSRSVPHCTSFPYSDPPGAKYLDSLVFSTSTGKEMNPENFRNRLLAASVDRAKKPD
jgi:hypothetical protein